MSGLSRPIAATCLLLAQGCACEGGSLPTSTESDTAYVPEPDLPDPEPPALLVEREDEIRPTFRTRGGADPYRGWQSWCEPADWDTPCEDTSACAKIADPSGRPTECATPWWSTDPSTKVCLPTWPGSETRQREIDNLRTIVDEVCTPPKWWRPGQGMSVGECWKHARGKTCDRLCDPDKLHALLVLVATRESTLRPWKRHRLNPDVKANKQAWYIHAARYGWTIVLDEKGGIRSQVANGQSNPYYADRHRWQGLGAYGQNSALTVAAWDPSSPPEVLCRLEVATDLYLQRLRTSWTKLTAGVQCDGETFHGSSPGGTPAWVDVHRGASTGRLCPHARDADFAARAASIRVGRRSRYRLDPTEAIFFEGLGRPLGDDSAKLAVADALRARLVLR